MTDITYKTNSYRITLETLNGFFGIWLKHNLLSRSRLFITLGLAVAMIFYTIVLGKGLFSEMLHAGGLPIIWKALSFLMMAIALLLVACVMVAIPIYILSPIASYLWLVTTFLLGPVRKRVNEAALTEQGITKTYNLQNYTTLWPDVFDLVETRKSLLIFTNRNCAMMIPKSAFVTTEQSDAFMTAARSYWQQARA